MSLRRWDPLRDLLSLQERMNRLFEESLARGHVGEGSLGSGSWTPLADVYETSEAFVVLLELPGVSEDVVEIQVDGDALTVRGERRVAAAARPDSFHRMERAYGAFSRTFSFGEDVDPDRVTAHFRDGLLRLDVRKVRPHPAVFRVRVERSE